MIIGYVSQQALALLFLFFGLTIAVIIKQVQKTFRFVPYTPTLFFVSMGLGYFAKDLGIVGQSIWTISHIDPRGILLLFLPPLIFEGAFNSDWYIFRKQSYQIFILAFPSVLLSAFFIMFSLKVIIKYDDSFYNYPLAFMFGSVLSCTDTVAVLALLKQAGAPKKFNSLIQGQSLFNDGTCMVLLTISLQIVKGGSMPILQMCRLFLQLTLGAIVLGVIFGMISTFLIRLIKKDSILTLNITVGVCYILYFVAEFVNLGIRISGIMALVSMGLYMAAFGKTKFTPDAKEKTHEFWKVFVFIAETIIFIIGGVIVGTKALNNEALIELITANQIQKLFLLYVCMTFARFFSIAIFMPKLQNQGYGLKWNEVCALTYGGLRGAIGIAFTLILASNDAVPVKTRIICLFNMAGCSFLTLLINAPTCGWVIKRLGVCVKSEIKVKLFRKFVRQCVTDLEKKVQDLHNNKHLSKSNWIQVTQKSGIQELKKVVAQIQITNSNSIELSQNKRTTLQLNLLTDSINDTIDPVLMKQIRNRYLIALKGIFWQKFENNQCSGLSVRNLTECVDLDLDNIDVPLSSWQYLIGHIHNPAFFPICFWLRNFPIIRHFAFTLIYDRVMVIYDIVSTYLEGLEECQQCCKMFPFQREVIYALINQSRQNRNLAQSYLDRQIKIAYPEIMKRIQTAKASHSLLTYQKWMLEESHHYGQLDERFYKELSHQIQQVTQNIENDSGAKQELSQSQMLESHQFFREMSHDMKAQLLRLKVDQVFQKDQPVIKAYEKQKYIYLITRGEVTQQYKCQNSVFFKKNTKLYQLAGISSLWNYNQKKQFQFACTAQSIVCLICFPIQTIKDIIGKNIKLETILYKEMLPFLLKTNNKYNIKISSERWQVIRPFVTYKKLQKDQEFQIIGQYIVLIEGSIQTDTQSYGPGYHNMSQKKIRICGPAKIFYSNSPFEEVIDKKSIGTLIHIEDNKVRASRQSRNTNRITNIGQNGGAFNRTLYTRDDSK